MIGGIKMDNINTFLEANYMYIVIGGIVVLIMLIGLLVGKSKKKMPSSEKTVDFKDVKTGNITDVVDVKTQPVVVPVEVVQEAPVQMEEPVVLEEPVLEQPQQSMPLIEEQLTNNEVEDKIIDEIPMPIANETKAEEAIIIDPLASLEQEKIEPKNLEETQILDPLVDYFSEANKSENNQ